MKNSITTDDIEYEIQDGMVIVSKTDLRGMITYANDAFVEVSGYSREELLGQPHNIVRHADMPKAAFADLWSTLEKGYPWKGVVKNAAINGGHYWVKAIVVPIIKNRNTIGYMSVRSTASRKEIEDAKKLYRELNLNGTEIKPKIFDTFLTIRFGYMLGSAFIIALLLIGGWLGIGGLNNSNNEIANQNNNRLNSIIFLRNLDYQLSDIQSNIADKNKLQAMIASIDSSNVEKLVAIERPLPGNPHAEKKLIDIYKSIKIINNAYADNKKNYALIINVQNNITALKKIIFELQNITANISKTETENIIARNNLIKQISLFGIISGIIIVLICGRGFIRGIVKPLEAAINNFDKMTEGDLSGEFEINGKGETGHLIRSSTIMQMHLKVIMDELHFVSRNIDNYCKKINTALFEICDHTEIQQDKLSEAKSSLSLNFTDQIKYSIEKLSSAINSSAMIATTEVQASALGNAIINLEEIINFNQLQIYTNEDFSNKIMQLSELGVANWSETQDAYAISVKLHTISNQLNELVGYFSPAKE